MGFTWLALLPQSKKVPALKLDWALHSSVVTIQKHPHQDDMWLYKSLIVVSLCVNSCISLHVSSAKGLQCDQAVPCLSSHDSCETFQLPQWPETWEVTCVMDGWLCICHQGVSEVNNLFLFLLIHSFQSLFSLQSVLKRLKIKVVKHTVLHKCIKALLSLSFSHCCPKLTVYCWSVFYFF